MPLLLVFAAGSLLLLIRGMRAVAPTTLLAPAAWLVATVVAVAAVEVTVDHPAGGVPPAWTAPARYVAAMLSFCPCMAVLGAKRPQDRAWQWVVASLWLVLSLPALQTLLFRPGSPVAPFAAWTCLLVALAALEAINYAYSRFRWSAALYLIGQFALIAPHFSRRVDAWFDSGPHAAATLALACWLAALLLIGWRRLPQPSAESSETLWRRFGDWYGTFWSFRVMGLVNQTAAVAGWPVVLTPVGLVPVARSPGKSTASRAPHRPSLEEADPSAAEIERLVRPALNTALRRFL